MKPGAASLAIAASLAQTLNYLQAAGLDRDGDRRRLDADEVAMLALSLEQLRTRVYEVDYPELKARMLMPVASDVDPGAETYAYEEQDYVGAARVIRNYADDLPSVEVKSTKVTNRVVSLGDSYHYSIQDLRRAAFSGRPLEARKAIAARRIYERGVDQVAAFGAPADGITDGLANRAMGSGAGQIRNTAMTATYWDSTPDAVGMVSDLMKAVTEFVSDSKETQTPDTLVLPTLQYLRLASTFTADNRPETAMERFVRTNGFIRNVVSWDLLKSVDGSGGNYSRGLMFRKDPDVFELVIPLEFEVLPPQPENLAFKVLCHGRTGGMAVYRPLGLRYLSAIPDT